MPRQKTFLSPDAQWQRTVALYTSLRRRNPVLEDQWPWLGIVVAPHKLFSRGDIVILDSVTGDCRHGCVGVTSKGRSCVGVWISSRETYRPGGKYVKVDGGYKWVPSTGPEKTTGCIEVVKCPPDLDGTRLDGAGALTFARKLKESLRAGPEQQSPKSGEEVSANNLPSCANTQERP